MAAQIGGIIGMWKTIQKSLSSTESVVSLVLGLAVVLVIGMLIFNYITRRGEQPGVTSEQAAQIEQPVSLPASHTVAQGETLWSIANTYYKSGYNWVDIQKANNIANADTIEVGQTLTIPQATPILPQQELALATEAPAAPRTYTVVRGDSLWAIALKEYNNGYAWVNIARANNLANPDLIHAGNVLTLP